MALVDYFGIFLTAVLVGGFIWALVDLLIKIVRRPKRAEPIDWTSLSPYPLVPEIVKTEEEAARHIHKR